ncbi:OsmC family protein [Enterobacter cloacae complex sp. P29RS]|uniref:OsmC family protein n=1 Tax=Enterobacter cloacae complex sp. P29RS TaxID=2779563 RepID=UPI001866874E|nr:OsmC family protein [Enterobacter cloacae complex sp. P29RS]MBE3175356.1 OsmC family protein [Enterobacter cloacae complex sp. P29RS]
MTLAITLESRSIKANDIYVTTEITGDKPQDLHIAHSVVVSLPEETTPELKDKVRQLITATDIACMIGNLLKAAGVRVSVSGDVTLAVQNV